MFSMENVLLSLGRIGPLSTTHFALILIYLLIALYEIRFWGMLCNFGESGILLDRLSAKETAVLLHRNRGGCNA